MQMLISKQWIAREAIMAAERCGFKRPVFYDFAVDLLMDALIVNTGGGPVTLQCLNRLEIMPVAEVQTLIESAVLAQLLPNGY